MSSLTASQWDVLRELATTGATDKEIARDLDISRGAVKVTMRTIFRRLDVGNRTQAALWFHANKSLGGVA
jgi:two-component system, NarL family, nitrate/nitrite response regulator NarL